MLCVTGSIATRAVAARAKGRARTNRMRDALPMLNAHPCMADPVESLPQSASKLWRVDLKRLRCLPNQFYKQHRDTHARSIP